MICITVGYINLTAKRGVLLGMNPIHDVIGDEAVSSTMFNDAGP